jgi:EAL domain-containing protein (putative c-di-GMP-specific phosphodiesterase class I)/CheY-like chemotaxis protein
MIQRILLVSEDLSGASSLQGALGYTAAQLLTANSSRQGLQILDETGADVVVSDDVVSDLSGTAFLRLVRERHPETLRLILTESAAIRRAVEAIVEAEVFRFLLKPCGPEELAFCIAQALQARANRPFGVFEDRGLDAAALHRILDRQLESIHMAYQPVVSPCEGATRAYEALLRPGPEIPGASELLGLAERLGRITELEHRIWSLVAACLPQAPPHADMLVNIHPHSLRDEYLYAEDMPLRAFSKRIVLEITERDSLGDSAPLKRAIARLRDIGYRIAIDDLTAGYAGLTAFALLNPDIVKFEMELIRGIDRSPTQAKLVRSMTALCRELAIQTIAEGVETEGEWNRVLQLQCDLIQGFYYGSPEPGFV